MAWLAKDLRHYPKEDKERQNKWYLLYYLTNSVTFWSLSNGVS